MLRKIFINQLYNSIYLYILLIKQLLIQLHRCTFSSVNGSYIGNYKLQQNWN